MKPCTLTATQMGAPIAAIAHTKQRFVGKSRAALTPKKPMIGRSRAVAKRTLKVQAAKDFDTLLMDVANQFEKADNKVAIAGWVAAAFSAITIAEWLIHLPALDILLGFPIQFIGLIATANLALRYYVDKEGEPLTDIEQLVRKVSSKLPGL